MFKVYEKLTHEDLVERWGFLYRKHFGDYCRIYHADGEPETGYEPQNHSHTAIIIDLDRKEGFVDTTLLGSFEEYDTEEKLNKKRGASVKTQATNTIIEMAVEGYIEVVK